MRTRTLLGRSTLGVLAIPLLAPALHAQVGPISLAGDSLRVGVGQADGLVWTAAALAPLLQERDYSRVLVLSALGRLAEERREEALVGIEPVMSALSASRDPRGVIPAASLPSLPRVPAAAQGLRACRTDTDHASATLCSMEQLVPVAPPALAREITEEGARLVALSSPLGLEGRAAGFSAGALGVAGALLVEDPFQFAAEGALERLWGIGAALSSSGGPGIDLGQVTRGMGLPPLQPAADVLASQPALRGLIDAHPGVLGWDAATSAFSGTAGDVLAGYRAFVADSRVGAEDAAAEWAAGRSFVYLAARSAELAGAERGVTDRIRTLGATAVDLRRESASFPNSVAAIGGDLAVAALTGNVLALASRVTGFFQRSPGSLGPGAGAEVRALRESIAGVRARMDEGFAGVDQQIEGVFGALDARLGQVEVLVESNGRNVQGQLASVHESVLALGERLDRLDVTVRSYMQAGFDREYARSLVRCLEHRERYLPPYDEMDFATFSACLSDFRARAVGDARDALLTDQATPLDDLSLVAALSDPSIQNLASRLTLLGRVASGRFGYDGLRGGRGLANPVEWSVAAEAYLSMLQEWPGHARSVTTGDLEAIRAVGLDLAGALQRITWDPETEAPSELLDRVLAYYDARLSDLGREADELARRHRQEVLLRVSPDQVLKELREESDRLPRLPVPEVVADAVPRHVRTFAVLGLDSAALTYRLLPEDSVARTQPKRRFLLFGKRHERHTYTRTRIEVDLHVGMVGPVATFSATGPFVLRRTEEMDGDQRSERVRRREEVVEWQGHFLARVWPALAANAGAWKVDVPPDPVMVRIESSIEAELRRYATVGLDNVFAAVCAESPSATGLAAADRATSLRMRSALHGLSAARSLLESYLRLGLRSALEDDPVLGTALVGPAGLLDRGSLCAAVADGDSGLRLVWLEAEPARRVAALRQALDQTVGSPPMRGSPRAHVDAVLNRLDASIRVQRLRASIPADG